MNPPFPFRKVYGTAAIIAAVTLFGLLSALLGEGIWKVIAWCALAAPLAVIVWKCLKAKRSVVS